MSLWDQFRLEFDEDGTLHQRGRLGWQEPTCPVCGDPIRWVLDMQSFKHEDDGSFAMCHARCLWKPEGFIKESERAAELDTP